MVSALALGARGHEFESHCPDHYQKHAGSPAFFVLVKNRSVFVCHDLVFLVFIGRRIADDRNIVSVKRRIVLISEFLADVGGFRSVPDHLVCKDAFFVFNVLLDGAVHLRFECRYHIGLRIIEGF